MAFAARRPYLAALLTAVGASLICILFIDKPLAMWIKYQLPDMVKVPFRWITHLADGTGWAIAAFVLVVGGLTIRQVIDNARVAETSRNLSAHGAYVLACLACGIATPILKMLIGRLRPRYLFQDGVYDFIPLSLNITPLSFPSGHSQSIFTLLTALAFLLPGRAHILLTLATMVTLSRVLIDTHFLGDTVFGAYLGIMIAVVLRPYFRFEPLAPNPDGLLLHRMLSRPVVKAA